MTKFYFTCVCILFLLNAGAQNADYKFLYAINSGKLPVWDKSMKALSFTTYPLAALSVGGILTQGYIRKDRDLIRNGYKSAVAIALAAGVGLGAKYIVKRTRPAEEYPLSIVERDNHSGSYSFPSGHSTIAFASATALALTYKKWYVAIPAFAYAGMVGYSRVRLGLHYPTDILGGMLCGIGSGLLTWRIDKLIQKK